MFLTYIDGAWQEGNVPMIGAMDHAVWLGSSVFDGARSVAGKLPDLRLHMARVIRSAKSLGMDCPYDLDQIEQLCREGVQRFPTDAELYIRPMVFGTEGLLIPGKSKFALTLFDAALPAFNGFSGCLSPFQRPSPLAAPTDAKACGLYANSTRALKDAKERGFDNAVVCDSEGMVAEFANANLFFVNQNDELITPVPNGTFLSGITRARIIDLLAQAGVKTIERSVNPVELLHAKEIFNTGNFAKVLPCTRYEDKTLAIGPVASLARQRYMDFMSTQ